MINKSEHTFHIPVMGLGYTIDTPVKVSRFGISSVVSIIQDHLVEQMREFYCNKYNEPYVPIPKDDVDHRAKRITAYLNLLQRILDRQMSEIKMEPFEEGNDIVKYFKLLPDHSPSRQLYYEMIRLSGTEKETIQKKLRNLIIPGAIDVNIMTKLDNPNYTKDHVMLPPEYCDAMAALRGFANSTLSSSIVFSAGLNPRLFGYLETFSDFFPDKDGVLKKKIILKVSDYRSAYIQGKFLAKRGLFISEFRIESGLNCGGHAFPTDGYLLGPILEEFKNKKQQLTTELIDLCNRALLEKKHLTLSSTTDIRITVQGGIGTANEDQFLRANYGIDGTGWGSPFLLVPEATNVDEETLQQLTSATPDDYFISYASPLGIPFNNFRKSTSEQQRKMRIEKKRAGAPCYKKFLAFNTEFTDSPICTASREYQDKKLKELPSLELSQKMYEQNYKDITAKDCLCEGLSSSVLLKNNLPIEHRAEAVTICPGPNLAYYSKILSLEEMVNHIYGRISVLNSTYRPHVFIKELSMYIDYLKDELEKSVDTLYDKQIKYFSNFKANLLQGIEYYRQLIPKMTSEAKELKDKMSDEIDSLQELLLNIYLLEEAKTS